MLTVYNKIIVKSTIKNMLFFLSLYVTINLARENDLNFVQILEVEKMRVGFVGFGEADSSIALGLSSEGMKNIICFDAMQDDPRMKDRFAEKIAVCGAEKAPSAADVCRQADIVISATPSNFAYGAAEAAAGGAHQGMIYMDVSTATPIDKKRIGALMEARGAMFVDGAMMGTLLKDRHQVPMLLCGSGAARAKELLDPYHMRLTLVDGEPGTATSIKFIRSITAKGLSCLLIESFQAAKKFGVVDTIQESFLDSFGPGFQKIMDGYISGAVLHAARREHEMENVVDFLKSEGLPCNMADATREKLKWINDHDVKALFEGGVPRDFRKVLDGWDL